MEFQNTRVEKRKSKAFWESKQGELHVSDQKETGMRLLNRKFKQWKTTEHYFKLKRKIIFNESSKLSQMSIKYETG